MFEQKHGSLPIAPHHQNFIFLQHYKARSFSCIYNAYVLKDCIRGRSFSFDSECSVHLLCFGLSSRAWDVMRYKRSYRFLGSSFSPPLLFLSQLLLKHREMKLISECAKECLMASPFEFSLYSAALVLRIRVRTMYLFIGVKNVVLLFATCLFDSSFLYFFHLLLFPPVHH